MKMKILLTATCALFSLGLFAQGKIYIVPQIECFVGKIKNDKELNNKQNFVSERIFIKKYFLPGAKISYVNKISDLSIGIEAAIYGSGWQRNEKRSNSITVNPQGFDKIDSRHFEAEGNGPFSIFIDASREVLAFNKKMPRFLSKAPEKPYLFTTKIAPVVGLEYRFMQRTFVNDFTEGVGSIMTSQQGNIPGSSYFHLNHKGEFSIRTGADWIFYKDEKRRFILTVMYHFAFREAGYWRYHYSKPGVTDFYYQTSTRGNGFSFKAAFPIKLYENKKRRK